MVLASRSCGTKT